MTGPAAGPRTRLGVQLGAHGAGPFGRRPEEDLPGVLAIVAGLGYDGAEFHPNVAYGGPAAVGAAFAAAGLAPAGLHVFDEEVADPAGRDQILGLATAAGCPRVILTAHTLLRATAGPGPQAPGPDRFKRAAELLGRLAEAAAPAGVEVSYHPHHVDFWALPDVSGRGLDVLLRDAPGTVTIALDLYWAHHGGADPAGVLAQLAGRVDYVHVRDGDARRTGPLGTGEVPLEPALRLLGQRPQSPAWLVYEDAHPRLPPTALCRSARDYLAARGFAGRGFPQAARGDEVSSGAARRSS